MITTALFIVYILNDILLTAMIADEAALDVLIMQFFFLCVK